MTSCVRFPYPEVSLSSVGAAPVKKEEKRSLWLISGSYHSDLVVETEWLVEHGCHLPESIKSYKYACFGWGDRIAYAKRWGLADVPQALFWESESIVQVIGFNGEVSPTFPDHDISEVKVEARKGVSLANFINHSFRYQPETKSPILLGDAKWGHGYFISSPYSYYAPRMCNQWISTALMEAGVTTVSPSPLNYPGSLKRSLRKYGAEEREALNK